MSESIMQPTPEEWERARTIMTSYGKPPMTRIEVAFRFLKEIKAERKRFDDEVERWYASEEGKKYRFPYCRHGRSLWVDHDIPCLACELGEDDNPYEVALGKATTWLKDYEERLWGVATLLAARRVFSGEVSDSFMTKQIERRATSPR